MEDLVYCVCTGLLKVDPLRRDIRNAPRKVLSKVKRKRRFSVQMRLRLLARANARKFKFLFIQ